DIASVDGVGDQNEHDRHGAGGTLQRDDGVVATGQNDLRAERDQLRPVLTRTLGIAGAPALADPHVAAVGPAQLLQALQEGREASLAFRTVRARAHEHADPPHALGLLRARRERPRYRRAAEERYECAPLHSITSSAIASRVGGMMSPRGPGFRFVPEGGS